MGYFFKLKTLIICYSQKTYVAGTHLMSTYNICFCREIRKISVWVLPLLTLVMLNKLRCHPTSTFQPMRLLDPDCWSKFTYLMTNRSQLIWICTVCKGRVYPGSAGLGLTWAMYNPFKNYAQHEEGPLCHMWTATFQFSDC